MTGGDEARVRGILRWYPRRWRRENGDVLVSTLREAAQRDGRLSPTAAEVRAAALHGTAARIDRRFALVAATIASLGAVVSGVLSVWALIPLAEGGLGWILPVLLTGVVPAFTSFGAISLVRDRGILADGRTLILLGLTAVGWALNVLVFASFSLGFDDDRTAPGLAAAWFPLAITGVIVGATAVGLVVEAALRRTALPSALRVLLSGAIGLVAAPVLGIGTISPLIGGAAALAVAVVAAMPRRRTPPAPATPPASRSVPLERTVAGARGRAAALLAGLAALGSAFGVVYALTGSLWSPLATDGTTGMAQGAAIQLLAALPLLGAVALLAARSGRSPLHVWGPMAAAGAGLLGAVAGYRYAPSWEGMAPWFQAASVLGGVAIAWWTIPRVSLPRPAAIVLGVSAGSLYAAFVGVVLTPALAFTVPVLAVFVVVRAARATATQAVPSPAP